eukprot:1175639-Prorocentrum_minimum.AAC.5
MGLRAPCGHFTRWGKRRAEGMAPNSTPGCLRQFTIGQSADLLVLRRPRDERSRDESVGRGPRLRAGLPIEQEGCPPAHAAEPVRGRLPRPRPPDVRRPRRGGREENGLRPVLPAPLRAVPGGGRPR